MDTINVIGHDALVTPSSDAVSRAIVAWTGYDASTEFGRPDRDPARLVEAFGERAAFELLPIVSALEEEFYASMAYNTVAGLREMAEHAANEFRGRHPELPDEAVAALAWCYSFDWK